MRSLFIKNVKKDNYKTIKVILYLIFSFIFSLILEKLLLEKYLYKYFSIDRVTIITFFLFVVFVSRLINVKEKLNKIYNHRYIFACIILGIIVLFGYSGSSINMYNNQIQEEYENSSFEEIIGKSRSIRSDEWAVNTPLAFSQNIGYKKYSYFSDKLRAIPTDMFTVINTPVLDIVSIGKLFNLGYLFGNRIGLSFWWYGRLVALILISFELCMILTNKNKKISIVGMLLIVLSPAVQWWYSNFITDILIWGSLIIVLVNKFMLSNNQRTKIFCLIGIAIGVISYIFTFYPAWIISFGYVYFALFVWVILKNKREYKINLKDIIGIILVIVFIVSIGIRYYMISSETLKINLNTDYPGERFILGGEQNGMANLFSYVYAIVLPFKTYVNQCEKSSMLSFYPIPIIMGIMLLIKDKENRKKLLMFLIPVIMVSALLSVWTFVETNKVFAKLTLLYMVPCNRGIIPLGFSQILLLIFVLGNMNKETKLFSKKQSIVLALVILLCGLYIINENAVDVFKDYLNKQIIICLIPLNILVFYLILSYNNEKKNNKKLYILLVLYATISGAFVNPVIKGVNVIYDKPIAKQIQKIVSENKEAIWITEDVNFTHSNYLVANGAKVVNCTNYYPSFDLYKTILGDEKFNNSEIKKIYNRYAHTVFKLVNDETDIKLITPDSVEVSINVEDIKQMNVKYILSVNKLEKYGSDEFKINKIYDELGMYIYELQY